MRLPSSSSLLLASLVVSSLSSLSALAAPVGDGPDATIAQRNYHLQTRNLVDKVIALLAVPPELAKAIPDILHAISPAAEHQGVPVAGSGHARRQVGTNQGSGGDKGSYVPSPPGQ